MLKTDQIMKRSIDGIETFQRTSDKFFNVTDVVKAYNEKSTVKKDIQEFFKNQGTKDYIEALKLEILNMGNSIHLEVIDTKRGRNGATWVHPYLFVKICFWLSPQFEVKVIKWVYDNLIDLRHDSGDYYKEMCETIKDTYLHWYDKKPDPFVFINEAKYINLLVYGDSKGKQRNESTEQQLQLLNKLQKLNIRLMKDGLMKDTRKEKLRVFAELTIKSE